MKRSDIDRLVAAASIAFDDLCTMGLNGQLGLSELWMAMAGAAEFTAAVAAGDIATQHDQDARMAACVACPHRTPHQSRVEGVVTGWCGERLKGSTSTGACGCLVTITRDGQTVAAGRAVVASKSCPRLPEHGGPVWHAVDRAT